MNGFVAKVFGFLLGLLSIVVLGGLAIIFFSGEVVPDPFGKGSQEAWIWAIVLFLIYVLVVGSLSVLVHTRELLEEQTELLKQIQFQLQQQNSISSTSAISEKTEPTI
jgi:hypothetical protein